MPINPAEVQWDAPPVDQIEWDDAPKKATPAKKGRSTAKQLGHEFSYQGREFLNGVGGLAGIVVDPVAAGMEKLGLPHGYRGRELSGMAADALGLDHPENGTERVYGDVQNALGGTAASFGVGALAQNGGRIAQGVGNVLRDRPALQAVSAGTGAAAGGITRENGGGQGAQIGASIVGSLLPGARPATTALARGVLRGGEAGRQNVIDTLEQFRRAGTTPTVGQATAGRVPRAVESFLSRTPGAAGVINRKAEQQASELGAKAGSIADSLAPGADPVEAGLAIERGIRGPGGYEARKSRLMSLLYDRVDQHIPQDGSVPVTNTLAALQRQTAGIAGAPATSERLRNGELANILDALTSDAGASGEIPYAALKGVRTELGHKVADASYGNVTIPKRQLSAAYGGMTQDMTAAAKAQGPAAERALQRANTHYAAGAARTEQIAPVLNAGAPEKIYRAAMAGTEGGATQLDALMRSLPKDAQQTVAATVIKRMGKATNGMQNEAGDVFSSQTFLTNWNKLSPQAKTALFSRLPKSMQSELESIAKVGANVRDGAKVYANPSGTAAAVAQGAGAASILSLLATGQQAPALMALTGAGAANGIARLMTSPRAAEFLSRQTQVPSYLLPGAINASRTK